MSPGLLGGCYLFFDGVPPLFSLSWTLLLVYLIGVSIYDFLFYRIKNLAIFLGFVAAAYFHYFDGESFCYYGLSLLIVYVFLALLEFGYRSRDVSSPGKARGIAAGDRKLLGVLAFWVGWPPVLSGFIFGIIFAFLYGFALEAVAKKKAKERRSSRGRGLPFAPFISFGVFGFLLVYSR